VGQPEAEGAETGGGVNQLNFEIKFLKDLKRQRLIQLNETASS
jgi:hypothetical protein